MSRSDSDEEWSSPKAPKKSKTSNCIIHCTDSTDALVQPESLRSWKSLLAAATIQQHTAILEIASHLIDDEIGTVSYHRRCRSSFILRSPPATSSSESYDPMEGSSLRRQSFPRTTGITILLPKTCIFCEKVSKGKTREKLNKCELKRQEGRNKVSIAQKAIHKSAKAKSDDRIIRLCETLDLIASEAQYHPSCYRNYTRSTDGPDVGDDTEIGTEESAPSSGQYQIDEHAIFQRWFDLIRRTFIERRKVTTVANLTLKLEEILRENNVGDDERNSKSFKKKARRKLDTEFGEAAEIFQNQRGKLIFLPNTVTRAQLANDYIELQKQYEKLTSESDKSIKSVQEAAMIVRNEVTQLQNDLSWPPKISELNPDNVQLPNLLQHFLSYLLYGSSKASVKTSSLGQDIIYIVHNGRFITSKHLLLPFAVKSMTGNVELIKILNRLGHGVSYTKLSEVDTAYAIQKIAATSGLIPDEIQPCQQASLVYDNIDRLEETLSGAGTTHRVNGIVIQKAFIGPKLRPKSVEIPKTKQRSIYVDPLQLPIYNVGSRPEPPVFPDTSIELTSNSQAIASKKNLIWFLCRNANKDKQNISSWTGFNIQIRKDKTVMKDNIGYLPTIDSPATAMNTVYEILSKARETKDELQLKSVVVVFDQAIYAKAIEIMWKHRDIFANIVPRLGAFHTVCVLLSVIGKRFGPAGLRDIIIESGTIEEGSVEAVLNGKAYNRAVRFHKLMFEACMRLIWEGYVEWLEENQVPENQLLDTIQIDLNNLVDNELDPAIFNEFLNSDGVDVIHASFQKYMSKLRSDNGTMSSFWISYVDLASLMLNLLRASREGDWSLHLISISELIPWCFACNRSNYARYLPWYLLQMINLPTTHPEVHKYLAEGGFSTQIGEDNPFGCIPMDQTIEETINKDIQTPGGTKGFSTKESAVSRYYITADYRASCVRQLRCMVNSQRKGLRHPDLTMPRITKDEERVKSLLEMFENIWLNPFDSRALDLCNISTGAIPGVDIVTDLLSAKEKGKEACKEFISNRLAQERTMKFFHTLPKSKLKSFETLKPKKVLAKDKEIILKADKNLFSMLTVISQSRNLDMKEVLSHPSGPIPWSLASSDGTLRKTNKAVLSNTLEKLSSPAEDITNNSACIIDAMSLVQKIKGDDKTFKEVGETLFRKIMVERGKSSRVDVVFDVYRDKSIKNAERKNRGEADATKYKSILPSHKIQHWRQFIKSSQNKVNLIRFLCNEWKSIHYRSRLEDIHMYLGYDEECLKLTAESVESVEHLRCNHEEADTRVFLHAMDAASTKEAVLIICEDTDVFTLGVTKADIIGVPIYQKRGTQNRTRFVNITDISKILGNDVSACIPGLHAFTGCDSVSTFAGKGKLAALKLLCKYPTFQRAFTMIGIQIEVSKELLDQLEEFTCTLYGSKTIKDVNKLRYVMFCAKRGKIESRQLPPCRDSLQNHICHANYQCFIWRQCLEQFPDIPELDDHG